MQKLRNAKIFLFLKYFFKNSQHNSVRQIVKTQLYKYGKPKDVEHKSDAFR